MTFLTGPAAWSSASDTNRTECERVDATLDAERTKNERANERTTTVYASGSTHENEERGVRTNTEGGSHPCLCGERASPSGSTHENEEWLAEGREGCT